MAASAAALACHGVERQLSKAKAQAGAENGWAGMARMSKIRHQAGIMKISKTKRQRNMSVWRRFNGGENNKELA